MTIIEEFKHESLQDAASMARYLDALKEAFQNGQLELSDERGKLVLHPRGLLGLEVQAKKKGGQVKIRIKFSWREDRGEARFGDLKIQSAG